MELYEKLTAEEKRTMSQLEKMRSAGIEAQPSDGGVDMEQSRGGDRDRLPGSGGVSCQLCGENILRYRALPLLGLPLGELLVLAPLAEDCAPDGRHECLQL
jgi:hypothetical protein